ncbi:MAG TPA: peptidylprolyl isomerase [Bryobacteraceae bacterium]|nr:peptidylprolyl isomerase [Bryobacteraceae bacterium]
MKRLAFLISFATLAVAQNPSALKPGLYAVFNTGAGNITALLYEKYTPATVANFVALAQGSKAWRDPKTGAMVRRPLYENIAFHRVIRGEAIQSGNPTGTSAHNCGVTIRDEFLPGLRFTGPGRLAMANTGNPDSGGCQFFITDQGMPQWDGKYTIFGEVVAGLDVVSKISHAPVQGEKPVDPVKLISVTIERIGAAQNTKRPN